MIPHHALIGAIREKKRTEDLIETEKKATSMEAPESNPATAVAQISNEIDNLQDRPSKLIYVEDDKGKECGKERVRIRRQTLQRVLEQCQKALESLKADDNSENDLSEEDSEAEAEAEAVQSTDSETAEFCDLLKSRVESPAFLDKLGSIHASIAQGITERPDEASSWDLVSDTDLQEGDYNDARNCLDQDSYVVVQEEDIVDGIACFMATYLSTLKQTKELTPKQLQKALSKTFSTTKKKGKLRKMWDSSKVIYNVVSWGATAVGIYQNPALIRAASVAFWTSCRVVSKLM
uniref:Uncharacterized protein n=1 Tax=Picea sitchensis TaxID=3332 RepID=A9P0Y3_PICSI|nr:unknown [Picea sitchensis]